MSLDSVSLDLHDTDKNNLENISSALNMLVFSCQHSLKDTINK